MICQTTSQSRPPTIASVPTIEMTIASHRGNAVAQHPAERRPQQCRDQDRDQQRDRRAA